MNVRLDDGTELFYTIDDFTDPWTEPETVVMHHGMAKSHKFWYAWVPIIAPHYRVVRFDMRGMGQSSVPARGYSWSIDNFANDLLGVLDKLGLQKVHLIGETVGGSIAMRFASLHQDRLLSLTACTSPVTFDSHHREAADLIDNEGIDVWVEQSIGRRLDPDIVSPSYTRWYADQMAATTPHVPSDFQRQAPGGDLRPVLKDVQTSTLILAAASLREEVLGDFRGAAELFPNGQLKVFPGVSGFVQHILPVPCARAWLDFAAGLKA